MLCDERASLEGVFIFVFHVLLNEKAMWTVRRACCGGRFKSAGLAGGFAGRGAHTDSDIDNTTSRSRSTDPDKRLYVTDSSGGHTTSTYSEDASARSLPPTAAVPKRSHDSDSAVPSLSLLPLLAREGKAEDCSTSRAALRRATGGVSRRGAFGGGRC